MAETYTFALVCSNCQHRWQVEIPRGKIVKHDAFRHCYWEPGEYLQCPHCGVTEYGPGNDVEANERLAFMPSQAGLPEEEPYPLDREHSELQALRKAVRRAKERIAECVKRKGYHPEVRQGCLTALTVLREETGPYMGEAEK